jgi:hypothetical protein
VTPLLGLSIVLLVGKRKRKRKPKIRRRKRKLKPKMKTTTHWLKVVKINTRKPFWNAK